jgi:paraquat-inducible protein A
MSEQQWIIACHECDLLQQAPAGAGVARCVRCHGVLFRRAPYSLERTLAYALTASVLFILANAFPLISMEVQGNSKITTVYGAVRTLWDQDMTSIAALVFLTIIAVPALQLAAIVYMLLPLQWGVVPGGVRTILRLLNEVKPWAMVEVFMLGVLVSVVKLGHLAHVHPGVAMWSCAGLIVAMAAMASAFHPWELWARVPWRRQR